MEFGYASMLMKEAGITDLPGLKWMEQLNEEARFSTHYMTASDVREAEHFTDLVVSACCNKWSRFERFYNHWIRWIY